MTSIEIDLDNASLDPLESESPTPICPACNGSGEGYTEGSTCLGCGGSGERAS